MIELRDEPPELWIAGRVALDLSPARIAWPFQRGAHTAWRWTLMLYPHPEGWHRGRGYWPDTAKHPGLIHTFRWWHLGPVELRRWVAPEP